MLAISIFIPPSGTSGMMYLADSKLYITAVGDARNHSIPREWMIDVPTIFSVISQELRTKLMHVTFVSVLSKKGEGTPVTKLV